MYVLFIVGEAVAVAVGAGGAVWGGFGRLLFAVATPGVHLLGRSRLVAVPRPVAGIPPRRAHDGLQLGHEQRLLRAFAQLWTRPASHAARLAGRRSYR